MEPITIITGARQRPRPRRRRHRPDHPQAVPQADRAHGLRRVPLLRLGEGAGLGAFRATRSSRPGATSAAAPRASTRRGRSRTTASARSSPRVRRHLLQQLDEDRAAAGRAGRGRTCARWRRPARARSTSRRRRSASRDAPWHFEIDAEIRRRLLGGLDDIALTLPQEDEIAAYEPSTSVTGRSRRRSDAQLKRRSQCSRSLEAARPRRPQGGTERDFMGGGMAAACRAARGASIAGARRERGPSPRSTPSPARSGKAQAGTPAPKLAARARGAGDEGDVHAGASPHSPPPSPGRGDVQFGRSERARARATACAEARRRSRGVSAARARLAARSAGRR